MFLQFSDNATEVKEEYLNSTVSKSTNKELDNYKFDIKVKGKENFEKFKREIEKYSKEYLNEIDSNKNIIRRFNIRNWNYRFVSEFDTEEASYLFEIEIVQVEKLHTNTLIIEGIENQVLKYKEKYDNDSIIIYATIKSTEEQRKEIIEAIGDKKYFNVIRPDINDNVLEMRYGKTIWSKHDGYIKRKIVLVEKKYDEKDKMRHTFFWPEMQNMMKMLAKNINYTENLERKILEKNILTKEEIDEIKKQSEENYAETYRQFYLVEDAEEEFDE